MHWIKKYQLFLFDLDGLLVDTEPFHYQAYLNVCSKRGIQLDLSFLKYCQAAHSKSQGLKDILEIEYPMLFANGAKWFDIYQEKKDEYISILKTAKIELMEGVLELLNALSANKIESCVVTNSTKQQTDLIIASQPALKLVDHWVTRESYLEPKPNPECYNKAIQLYGRHKDKIIGFEDSVKGINALLGSPAKPVLINALHVPQMEALYGMGDVSHYTSLKKIPETI